MRSVRRIASAYIAARRARHPVAMALLAGLSPAAEAAEADVRAGARVRGEAIAGSFRAGGPSSEQIVLTRLNLFVEADLGPLRIGGELQDARAPYATAGGAVDEGFVNALEPIQAYVAADVDGTRLQAGRFTLDLGSRRLVARPNFRNTSAGFTGIRADWGAKDAPVRATAFWVLPQARLPDDDAGVGAARIELDRERFGLQLFGGIATLATTERHRIEATALRLSERDAPGIATRDRRLWTGAARWYRPPAPGMIDHDVEAAWQLGRARASSSSADRDDRAVSAGFVQAGVGYTWRHRWRPRIRLAVDYASGDRRGRTLGRFDTIYGDGSFEFGPSSLYALVARANLVSAELRAEAAPDDASDAYLAFRPLWLASATDGFGNSGVRDPSGASGRHAGTQVEARLRRWLVPRRLRLAAGGAYLVKGRFLRDAPNAPATGDTAYGYLELSLDL